MRKILVLRGGALGDFLVTLPALTLLRKQWPEARIELAGNAVAAELARVRGMVDAVYSQHEARWSALFAAEPLPESLGRWLGEYDLVLNHWPDPEGELGRHFPVRTGQKFLSAAALPTLAPAAAHYCEPLRSLGLVPTNFFCPLSRLDGAGGSDVPAPSARDCIAIHPGSGSPAKNWPIERWWQLITTIDAPLLLVLGEAELPGWTPRVGDSSRFRGVRLAVDFPLERLVTELSRCALFLGHDSGISHLAAACGVPCLLLFGPTDPAMWAPPAPHVRVLRNGPDLESISVDDVNVALRSITTEAQRPRN